MERVFPLRYPYSFEATVRRLVSFEKSSYRLHSGRLVRAIEAGGRPYAVEIGWQTEPRSLTVYVHGNPPKAEQERLEAKLRRMFSVDVDLTPFYRQAEADPYLGPVVAKRKGLHLVLDASLYECLIKTIISQQLNLAFAAKLIERLVDLAGERVPFKGESLPVFPSPERVAALDYEQLQALQFNRRKAEYIIDISRRVASGTLDLETLWRMEDEAVMECLLPLRGVGRWTVECLLLFGLGRPDLLPAADIGLRNAVRHVYGLAHQPGEEEIRKIGRDWSPWRSYATFYLWDALSEWKPKKKGG
ncbi:hypothetical protein JIR001_27540 [Polycladomyces abyssicola]|uniref:DNA-3-methyladenine glycosylase II n=1 Tax=Polycladomyces abyssicola TaxID=1125966 RepID=A0A8D5UIA6_9BACL|nr:DNA-3-methyladenine glycosylase [Polycladomyces abyssicola]BCU82971.1 hypothetical protein JIR001_27540 [Polycladomyces abyssicola]